MDMMSLEVVAGKASKKDLAEVKEWPQSQKIWPFWYQSGEGSMNENDIVDSGIPLPRMATVQPLHDFVLRVKWGEGPRAGREDLVDVSPAIFSYKVYRPLRDENLFLTGIIAKTEIPSRG